MLELNRGRNDRCSKVVDSREQLRFQESEEVNEIAERRVAFIKAASCRDFYAFSSASSVRASSGTSVPLAITTMPEGVT